MEEIQDGTLIKDSGGLEDIGDENEGLEKIGLLRFLYSACCRHTLSFSIFIFGFILTGALDAVAMCSLYPIMDVITGGKTENRVVSYIDTCIEAYSGEPTLVSYIIVFGFISFVAGLIYVGVENYKGYFLKRMEGELRDQFTDHVLSMPWIDLAKLKHGYFTNALLKDVDSAIRAYLHLLTAIGTAFTAIILFGMMVLINAHFTLITLLSLASVYFVLNPLIRITHKFGERFIQDGAHLAAALNNVARAFKEIKAVSNEHETSQHLKSVYRKLEYSMMMLNTNLVAFRNRSFEFAGLGVLCFLIYMALNHLKISSSDLLILIAILIRAIPLVSSTLGQLSNAMSFLPGYQQILSLMPEISEVSGVEESDVLEEVHCLELRKVSFSYDAGQYVLKGFQLKVKKGEICVIKGGSGTGKSTILDLLSGLLQPSHGQVLANDIDIHTVSKTDLHQRLTYLPQFCFVFAGSLRDNILWGGGDSARLSEAIKFSQLAPFVTEKGQDYQLTESGQNLSGGQRQRVGLARAFAKDGDFLLLDEPTSALDMETEKAVVHELNQLKADKGMVIITHREELLKIADQIIDLDEG